MSRKVDLESAELRELARKADAIVARHGSTAKVEIETGIAPGLLNRIRRLRITRVNQTLSSETIDRIEKAYLVEP